jgi:hypothetical protein
MWVLEGIFVSYLSPVSDILLMGWLMSTIGVLKLVLIRKVFLPLGLHCLPRQKMTVTTSSDSKDHNTSSSSSLLVNYTLVRKFVVSCWRATAYLLLVLFEMYLIYNQPFFYDTKELWKDWPLLLSVRKEAKLFYLTELGFYLEELCALYIEPKMKDRFQMLIHHIVTIILIGGSYILGLWKVGLYIMLVHDISDPLLELAKLLLYCKRHFVANTMFVVFAAVFIVSRCIYYPLRIIRSC